MAYDDELTGQEVVPLTECVRYLESTEVGRIAFSVDGQLHLYPINYMWDGVSIVFRTDQGSPLANAAGTEMVFETDHLDMRGRSGWSVIARGVPKLVDPEATPNLASRLRRLALYPWTGGAKELWLQLVPAPLTGRRVNRVVPD